MSTISLTKLYDLLCVKLGKETAGNLTTFIDNKIDHELENKTNLFATKQDIADLKVDLKVEIREQKSDTIKWMFIFWAGQMLASFGLLLIYFKK